MGSGPPSYPAADRLKTNAYSALRELHHFCQIGTNQYSVKYPTENLPSVRNQCYPYNLILLGWPDAPSHEAEDNLNQGMAERLFANAFCPDADPFVHGVNAKGNEKYGENKDRHTLFCTFGMSVLEFPGPRLVEYGAARLLRQTLQPWLELKADSLMIQADVTACGVDYESLKSALRSADPGLENLLRTRIAGLVESTKRDPSSFSRGLAQLQSAFGDHTGGGDDTTLPHAAVPQRLKQAQSVCVDKAWERIRDRVAAHLQDWQRGPGYALDFLSEVSARLKAAKGLLPAMSSVDAGSPDAFVHCLRELREDFCVRFLLLASRAVNAAGELLRADLDQYVTARQDRVVAEIMGGGASVQGLRVPGVLDAIDARIDILSRRLANFRLTVGEYVTATHTYADALRVPPRVNGVTLMDAGTADRAYSDLLAPHGDAAALQTAEKERGAALLASFAGIAATITEVGQPCAWDNPPSHSAARQALPAADRQILEAAARQPFQSLRDRNVFAEWSAARDPGGIAGACVKAAGLSLSPDEARAHELRGSRLDRIEILIQPDGSRADFDKAVGGPWEKRPGGVPARAIFLREVYCIPPEAMRGVTATADQPAALETARFDGYRTYTRNDVCWGPMSDGEWQRLDRYEQLLAVAIQIGRVRVAGGMLLIEQYPREDMGNPPYRKLSATFPAAVRQWALSGRDNENLDLAQLEVTLSAAIDGKIRSLGGEQFVARLNDGLEFAPAGVIDWDVRRVGKQLSEFCTGNAVLNPYHQLLFAPHRDVLEAMWCSVGQRPVHGPPANVAGYYCLEPHCGSRMGASKTEAARLEWRCPTCATDHSISGKLSPDWVTQANIQKSLGGTHSDAPPVETDKGPERPFSGAGVTA